MELRRLKELHFHLLLHIECLQKRMIQCRSWEIRNRRGIAGNCGEN